MNKIYSKNNFKNESDYNQPLQRKQSDQSIKQKIISEMTKPPFFKISKRNIYNKDNILYLKKIICKIELKNALFMIKY